MEASFVASALIELDKSETTLSEVATALTSTFPGLEWDDEVIWARLDILRQGSHVQLARPTVTCIDLTEFERVEKPLDALADQFFQFAKHKPQPRFWAQNPDWKTAVTTMAVTFLEQVASELGAKTRVDVATHRAEDNLATLTKAARGSGTIRDPAELVALFLEYVEHELEGDGSEIFGTVLHSALSYDLLCRGDILQALVEEQVDGAIAFLDSNVIIGALCPQDREHEKCNTALQLARSAGYRMFILPATEIEVRARLTNWMRPYDASAAKRLEQLDGNPVSAHFHERSNPSESWLEFRSYYDDFMTFLETLYGLQIWNRNVEHPNAEWVAEFEGTYNKALARTERDPGQRSDEAVAHDSSLIYNTAFLYRLSRIESDKPPVLITLDSALHAVSRKMEEEEVGFAARVHRVGSWIARLRAILGPKVDRKKERDLLEAILNANYRKPKKQLLARLYLESVAVTANLPAKVVDTLYDTLAGSATIELFEEQYEGGDSDAAEQTLIDWLHSDEALSAADQSAEVEASRDRLHAIASNLASEKAARQEAEKRNEAYEVLLPALVEAVTPHLGDHPELMQQIMGIVQGLLDNAPDALEPRQDAKLVEGTRDPKAALTKWKTIIDAMATAQDLGQLADSINDALAEL